jgi:hypothetical protein
MGQGWGIPRWRGRGGDGAAAAAASGAGGGGPSAGAAGGLRTWRGGWVMRSGGGDLGLVEGVAGGVVRVLVGHDTGAIGGSRMGFLRLGRGVANLEGTSAGGWGTLEGFRNAGNALQGSSYKKETKVKRRETPRRTEWAANRDHRRVHRLGGGETFSRLIIVCVWWGARVGRGENAGRAASRCTAPNPATSAGLHLSSHPHAGRARVPLSLSGRVVARYHETPSTAKNGSIGTSARCPRGGGGVADGWME